MNKTRIRRRASSADPATRYALLVTCGDIVAGPHVRAECKRHLDDLKVGKKRGLTFDLERAQFALDFFPSVLRLSDGQFDGKPFNLAPPQEFIVGRLFGWYRTYKDKATGEKITKRRFTRAYVEMGKGNGKSPLAAGIGLFGMFADGENRSQVFAAAAKLDQARILFDDAVAMVEKSAFLSQRISAQGINPVHNLTHRKSGSFFRPVGRDTGKTGSGWRPHFILVDELHEHPNRQILEVLERGFKSRLQPLNFMITNSGSDRNSVCYEEHASAVDIAHQIQTGANADETFTYVCALDEGDDPLNDPSCFEKANPLLGAILTEDYLLSVASQARAIPGKANNIRRLHFCQWTDADSAWIGRDVWEACEDPAMAIEDFIGQPCFAGLDLGATKDMTARAMVFPDGFTDDHKPKFALFAHGYTPADTLFEREISDKAPYPAWVEGGFLTATPGKVVRLDYVAHDLVEFSQDYDLEVVAYDRWLIRYFEQAIDEMGATLPLMEHPQSVSRRKDTDLWMPGSIEMFEDLLLEGRLRIAVNPALRSAVASTTFWESPAGLRRFEKQRSTGRIDLAVASAMAIGAATVNEEREEQSFLATSDLVFV